MKTKLFHKLTAAVCALALLLSLVPAAFAANESDVKLTVDVMLAPPTFADTGAIKTDGSLWSYDVSRDDWNLVIDPTFRKADNVKGKSADTWTRVDENDSLWIWGWRSFLDGSDMDLNNMLNAPVKVMDGVLYADFAMGWATKVVLKKDGTLWTWYENPSNPVKLMDNVVQVKNNETVMTALKADGTLWDWGFGVDDQELVGEGYVAFSSCTVGSYYGIKADGSLWAWGNNKFAALGLGYAGSTDQGYGNYVETPRKVMDNVVCVDAENDYAFAVTADGSLYAWGRNNYSRLGFSGGDISVPQSYGSAQTDPCQSKPRKIMDGVVMVRDGIVLKADGTLWANRQPEYFTPYTGFKKIMDNVMLPSKGIVTGGPSEPAAPVTPVTPAAAQFTDVPSGHWAQADIEACANAGIVTGVGNGKFAPDDKLTGIQFIVMLTRTFYNDEVEAAKAAETSSWYAPNLKAAADAGMTKNLSAQSISDTGAMTRYDMALILYNVIVQKGKTLDKYDTRLIGAAASLKDWNNIPLDYQAAVRECCAQGIITGMSDRTFSGSQTMTRAQACVVMARMMKLING